MIINRIQVDDGFLRGFDLHLSAGLNVIIGARGTGKTSVIELIRYALSAKNHTSEAEVQSANHAREILQGGEVCVELVGDLGELVSVSRSGSEKSSKSTSPFSSPIVLSQTEIETVGLSKSGRLALIDGFVSQHGSLSTEEARVVGFVKSLFKEIQSAEAEVARLSEGNISKTELLKQLDQLEVEQKRLQQHAGISAEKQKILNQLNERVGVLAGLDEEIGALIRASGNWMEGLESLQNDDYILESWDSKGALDPLLEFRPIYKQALDDISKARASFSKAWELAQDRREAISAQRLDIERSARQTRNELDSVAQGLGSIARQISLLQAQLAQIGAREVTIAERSSKVTKLRLERNNLLQQIENIRAARSNARTSVANRINEKLGPHIAVSIDQSAQYENYAQEIANALRGSGMKYAEISNRIAEHISPRELLMYVEDENYASLSKILEIPQERAARLSSYLKEHGLADVVTCLVEDDARMSLLDGVGYKDISSLSAGQRCTVILSIVLQHEERALVIDQPEDHLDNAFIASTVIRALRKRKGVGQVILSTHNANIPVLGEADLVVQLTSDGRNGFVQVCKPLSHPDAVHAITSVMEGGRDAFNQRATFYSRNSYP